MIHSLKVLAGLETYRKYVERLNAKGIKLLGRGLYASVFQHPKHPEVVVRVSDRKFSGVYATYLKFCQRNQGNPWVPKLYGKPVLKKAMYPTIKTRTRYIEAEEFSLLFVFMEKLLPCVPRDMRILEKRMLAEVKETALRRALKTAGYVPRVDGFLNSPVFWQEYSKLLADTSSLKPLAYLFASKGKHLDMKEQNLMKRPNGEIVFTDPFDR